MLRERLRRWLRLPNEVPVRPMVGRMGGVEPGLSAGGGGPWGRIVWMRIRDDRGRSWIEWFVPMGRARVGVRVLAEPDVVRSRSYVKDADEIMRVLMHGGRS